MGASHSHGDSNCYHPASDLGKKHHKGTSVDCIKPPRGKGKPSPPSQPQTEDVTHNSVTLTWLPPRHNCSSPIVAYTVEMTVPGKNKDKQWATVTTTCQGNSYQVKNLTPNSEYLFRVRAENIHGVSKPSRPSDLVQTKMYEIEDKTYGAPEPETKNVNKRRHSFNLQLDGAVTTILNHTDIEVKSSQPQSGTEKESSRITTLQRDAAARSSLQPNRKRSLPILLPGTRTNSMTKLRDSQTVPNIKSAASDSNESLSRRRAGSRLNTSSDSEGKLDDVEGKSDRNESSTDDDSRDRSQELKKLGSEEGLDSDPWEKDDSVNGMSERITSAPLCDDMKLALYSRSLPENSPNTAWVSRSMLENGEEGQADFRTIRSLLHSDNIIVKPSRSLPDINGNGGKKLSVSRNNNNNNNGKLSTIVDLEEDEESVRITTL